MEGGGGEFYVGTYYYKGKSFKNLLIKQVAKYVETYVEALSGSVVSNLFKLLFLKVRCGHSATIFA